MFIYRVILCPENRRRQEHTNKVSEKWSVEGESRAKINLQKSPVIQKEFSNFILNNHGDDWWSLFVIHNYNS